MHVCTVRHKATGGHNVIRLRLQVHCPSMIQSFIRGHVFTRVTSCPI
jgi:hypothetical protein